MFRRLTIVDIGKNGQSCYQRKVTLHGTGFLGFPDQEGEEIYIDPTQTYMIEIPEFMLDGNDEMFENDTIDDIEDGAVNPN